MEPIVVILAVAALASRPGRYEAQRTARSTTVKVLAIVATVALLVVGKVLADMVIAVQGLGAWLHRRSKRALSAFDRQGRPIGTKKTG